MKLINYLILVLTCLVATLASAQPTLQFTTPIQSIPLDLSTGSASATFTINNSDEAVFRVIGFVDMTFELTLPDGSVVDDSSAQADGWLSQVLSPEDVGVFIAPAPTLYLAKENPDPGTYLLTVTSSSSSPEPALAQNFSVETYTGPVLRRRLIVGNPLLPTTLLSQNEATPITVAVFEDTTPVTGLTITASVTSPSGTTTTLDLLDNGAGLDAVADDGLYTATFVPNEIGRWVVQATSADGSISAIDPRVDVDRADIRLSGEVTDRAIDEDGDGLVDGIELTFGTTGVRTGDTYYISAALEAEDGNFFLETNRVEGDAPITVYFPAINPDRGPSQTPAPQALEDIGLAPSYNIIEVRLGVDTVYAGEAFERALDRRYELGRTGTYTNYERDNTIINGIIAEEAGDFNNDGIIDYVELTVSIDTLILGDYFGNAQLKLQDGTVITSGGLQFSPSSLDAGPQQEVVLVFEDFMQDVPLNSGPLEVVNFSIYADRSARDRAAAVTRSLGFLQDYSATDDVELDRLRLTSMCDGRWRVRNSNTVAVDFTWDVFRGSETGSGVAQAGTDTLFETSLGAKTVRLFVDGEQQDVKASNPAPCN